MHYSKKGVKCLYILFITLLTIATESNAQADKVTIKTVDGRAVTIAQLDSTIAAAMDSLDMPGLSIAIINDAEIAYHNVLGVTNSETKVPVTEGTVFEGASLSKPIFAYFVMKMVDKGILDLDKPIYKYLPHPGIAEESQEEYKLITARMVLSHSSGFPNHSGGEKIVLKFKPGTDFSYSGEAYQYLAAVVGTLNGVGWKEGLNSIFENKVTKPLEMSKTSFLWNDYLAEHKAYGHKEDGTPTDNGTGDWDGKTFFAYSSIHSEALDYSKFIVAMLQKDGLKRETFEEMLKTQNKFNDDNAIKAETGQTGWGLGFAQKPTPYGRMHLHTGNNRDFQAYAMFVPRQKYGLVLFSNSGKMLPFINQLEGLLGEIF